MTDAVDHVAETLLRREPACGRTRVVAIDGRSGAGKTEFAHRLADRLDAPVFPLEEIYPGWHGLEPAVPMLRDVLAALAVDELGRAHRWDWIHDRRGVPLTIAPGPLLIVDGVGSGSAAIRPFLSLLVWLEADEATRRHRALARDGETYRPWWSVWAEQERRHLGREHTPAAADILVRTD
ncbi:hypothetical protein BHE97_04170 [Aeromicrobium sp. PE09-221]|uniref:hypothetical protein n=1 Tax=Aeromicrobium sp. PE09-221 TaxID=1898043 RepID=UPI000B3EBBBD|nr:hypothetical protein [Aeromicrobium sp. PE09-221]OUZ11708.1 hypothetical protein BHE97_04170 [Aeromicrobium sp. PE09-221]